MIDQWCLPWVGKERVETRKPDLYLLYLWFCHLCLLSLYEGLFIALLSSDCLVNRSRIPTPRITEEQTPSYLPFSSGLFALKVYKNFWRPWEFKLRNTKFHPSITSSEGTRQTLKLEYKPSMKADTCLAHWGRILSCWSSNTLATWCEQLTHWKRPWCWETLKAEGEEGNKGWDGWMASPIQWTWTWANSRRWQGTGKPGMLQSMGSQSWTLGNWTTTARKASWTSCQAV